MKMAGKTAFQKIIDAHCVKVLPADGRMVLKPDRVWGHEITPPIGILDAKEKGIDVVFNPNKIKMMIDHVNPPKDTDSAVQRKICYDWSGEHGTEFLDTGRGGVCHVVIPENGWILPGEIGIMPDSHTCTHGAFCAFTAGIGTTEFENAYITGLWVCPPQKVIRVNFTGKLPANVFAKDLILALISYIGVRGATNAVLEFGGPVIEAMSMEARMTMTNMAVEAGATSGMMMVDKKTVAYLREVLKNFYNEDARDDQILADLERWNSDPDAEYGQVININATNMVPMITYGHSPAEVISTKGFNPVYKTYEGSILVGTEKEIIETNIFSLEEKKVDQVYIGSCTNGRIEDLRIAAGIFAETKGRVADSLRCIVVPGSQRVYNQALDEGLLKIFAEADCFVAGPTCGACLGMSCGVLAPGEVCVSTTNRNFPGRMGKGGMVHLASPATATLTAIKGAVVEPDLELCASVLKKYVHPFPSAAAHPTGWTDHEVPVIDYAKLAAKVAEMASSSMDFSGEVFCLPVDNVDTDQIIPARWLNKVEKKFFGEHLLEDAPISPEDRPKLQRVRILVGGENFGCGSSREMAPMAFEAAEIRCIIAPSFARIFENNMFARGLLCITLPKADTDELMRKRPDSLGVDLNGDGNKGYVCWAENAAGICVSQVYEFNISDYQKELIRKGGSTGVMLELAAELQKEGKL